MNDLQPLNQAVVTQVMNDLRNGQLRRCLSMGFSHDDLALLRKPELVSVLLNTNVSWCNVTVNAEIMHRLLNQAHDTEKEIYLIDSMLLHNASSKMIHEVFGLNQREVAFRRKLLGLNKKRGRWIEITEKQEHKLWHLWKSIKAEQELDTSSELDMAKSCMTLAQESGLPMASIWPIVKKWIEQRLT